MNLKEFQAFIEKKFVSYFQLEVKNEWRSKMIANIYSPRIDLAVGPFAFTRDENQTVTHSYLFDRYKDFFEELARTHLRNVDQINSHTNKVRKHDLIQSKLEDLRSRNMNGRCFIAVEIENEVSRKHLLGGAVNCSALGKVGIAIGFNDKKHAAFCNLYRYFQFLDSVNKPTYNTSNLVIISKSQMESILL